MVKEHTNDGEWPRSKPERKKTMKDKNGIELKTGHIVEITGGFFKTDSGRFVIVHSPGDADWLGKYYSLCKVSKKDEISLAKYSTSSWPLSACTSDYFKNIQADAHNAKNAQIEVVGEMADVKIKDEIACYERQKKQWHGNTFYLERLQGWIDELKAKLAA